MRKQLTPWAVLGCVVMGGVGAYFVHPYVSHDSDIVIIVVTIFSVFAGFLIATIAIIGDPRMIHEGSWRIAEAGREKMQRRLSWHISLLFIYLLTLALLFAGVVLQKALPCQSVIKDIVEAGYLFFGISGFLLTFALPIALRKMQQEMYDAEIERRRKAEGINPGAGSA
jgi:hypothetical protein